eukprot:TRINITY_DN22515_c0_g1_i1.p1 TRINITY_DN22515_c0_g1~~TRINITY_DN22515_c0_g1_i1.p1  ORF type:complete len:313 (-),score=97.46 TRINITY_DN22515_c0_g1_i1:100-1038(-)
MRFQRQSAAAAVLLASSSSSSLAAGSVLRGQQLGRLEAWGSSGVLEDLRPDVVAELFRQVAHSWVQDRAAALQGAEDAQQAHADVQTFAKKTMVQSCAKVANSIVQGSSGDERRVAEYMKLVCARLKVDGESHSMCSQFGRGIVGFMRGDAEFNRHELKLDEFCTEYYEGAVVSEAARLKAADDREVTQTTLPPAPRADAEPSTAVGPKMHLMVKEDTAADKAEERLTVHVAAAKAPRSKMGNSSSLTSSKLPQPPTVVAVAKPIAKLKGKVESSQGVPKVSKPPTAPQVEKLALPLDEEEAERMIAAMPGH